MNIFKSIFETMAKGIGDLSSLDIVTMEGTVEISDTGTIDQFKSLDALLAGNVTTNLKIIASTQTKMDGDIVAFFDKDANETLLDAHSELMRVGIDARESTISMIKSLLGSEAANIEKTN